MHFSLFTEKCTSKNRVCNALIWIKEKVMKVKCKSSCRVTQRPELDPAVVNQCESNHQDFFRCHGLSQCLLTLSLANTAVRSHKDNGSVLVLFETLMSGVGFL